MAQSWFPFGVHLIKGLVQTVRNIESTARQREALVALGTLAAGLAHEINNPASASTRAVDALQGTADALLSSLRRLAEAGISAETYVELDALRRSLRPASLAESPLARADREDELSDWLAEHDVSEDWLVAPALAAGGADPAWCQRVADVVGPDGPRRGAALGLELAVGGRPVSARSRSRPSGSRTWWRRSGPTPSSTGPRSSAPTSRRGCRAR